MEKPRFYDVMCKPLIRDAYEGVRVVNPHTHKSCPDSTPIWYWDFGSLQSSEIKVGNEYHSLIQVAGGPDTTSDPGITNSVSKNDYLIYGTLKQDKVFRTLFRVRRGENYLYLQKDDDLMAGDILEFWGPSEPGDTKLFLTMFGPDTFGLRRIPFSRNLGISPEVELRVRTASLSNTKKRARSERGGPPGSLRAGHSTYLPPRNERKTGCLSTLCKAAAKGLRNLVRGAQSIFSGADSSRREQRAGAQNGARLFADDLITFADRSGTGRVRLRDSISRHQTQNTEPTARRQSNRGETSIGRLGTRRGETPDDLTGADEGIMAALPRTLNLGPLGLARIQKVARTDLSKITEGTEGVSGIDTHQEIRTAGLADTRPIVNTMTTSHPDTHGHFGSEILSPKNPQIIENLVEEEEEEDEGDEEKGEEQEDASPLSITVPPGSEEDDFTVNNPPVLRTREGGPGARKSALDFSRLTSTHGSQPMPVEKQPSRPKPLTESYSGEFE
ncbi:hypothetical protein TWF281_008670 [Arthrobotrys megalospora]